VAEEHFGFWWGLSKRANGDVYGAFGTYSDADALNGRMVDGVVVPV